MSYFQWTRVSGNVEKGKNHAKFVFPFIKGVDKSLVDKANPGCQSCTNVQVYKDYIEATYTPNKYGTNEHFHKMISVKFKDGTVEKLFFEGYVK